MDDSHADRRERPFTPPTKVKRVFVLGLRSFDGTQGGIETHVRTIVTAIAKSRDDYAFEVIERQRYAGREAGVPNVKLMSLWSPKAAWLEAIVHSLLGVAYAAVKRPDLLHVHGIGPSLIVPLARMAGLRVICTHHGEDYARDKWGLMAKLALMLGERFAVRFSCLCIVIAPSLAARLSARYGRRVSFIPNPLPNLEHPNDPSILGALGLRPKSYFLHVGRHVPEKRQLELIAAYRASGISDWPLVLVGAADHTSPYSDEVAAVAAQESGVIAAGVRVGRALSTLMANAGAFVLPSSHEGLPIALLEAMSFGLPVAVSDIDNLAAMRLPDRCYFPVADVAALTAALAALRRLDGARIDWGDALGEYDLDKVRNATTKAYQTCLDRGHGR